MAFRPATPEEVNAALPTGFRPATTDEVELASKKFEPHFKPPTETTVPRARTSGPSMVVGHQPGVTTRMLQRFLGTDVDDPMELERLGAVAVGAISGAKAGASAGAMLGPLGAAAGGAVGGVAGASAGSAVPELTLEFMESLGVLPSGAREERALSDEEMRRVMAGEALLEATFFGAATGTRAAGRFAGRRLGGVTKESERLAEAAAKEGINLPPSVVGESGVGKMIVNVLGRFPFMGTAARRAAEESGEALKTSITGLPDRIGPLISESALGQSIFEDSKHLFKEVSGGFGRQYDELFLEARRVGVYVEPKSTREAADAVVQSIVERSPAQQVGMGMRAVPAAAGRYVREFVSAEMDGLTTQSLAQMDELIAKVDQAISSSPKEIRRSVAKLLSPIKGAAKADVVQNMSGEGADAISQRLAALDADFSRTMAYLFETSTAKRMGSVRRQGLKAVVKPSEEATRVPVDRLAGIILDTNSPQAIDELSRLVSPETFRKVGSRVLSDALNRAITTTDNGATMIKPEAFAKALGLSSRPTAKGEAIERLLKDTGLSRKHLEDMTEIMRRMSSAPTPNVSTFIARRATIGGTRSLVRGMLPFLAIGGGTAAGGGAGSIVGGLTFLLGGRALVKTVSDPTNARALAKVLDKETGRVQRRVNTLVLLRSGISAMEELSSDSEGAETPAETSKRASGALSETGKRLYDFGQEMFRQLDERDQNKAVKN